MRSKGTKLIAENRKARHEYFVLESYEAGIELVGTEVKSIRQGAVNLKDSWCSIDNGEIFVRGMNISTVLTMKRCAPDISPSASAMVTLASLVTTGSTSAGKSPLTLSSRASLGERFLL